MVSASLPSEKTTPSHAERTLWHHRDLLWQLTIRNVELRHKGSYLGLGWSILSPLLILGLEILVFGYVFNGSFGVLPNESRVDYGLGIFVGMTLYQFLAEVLATAPGQIVTNANFVKKVVFPLEALPAAAVGAAFIHTLISLGLVIIGTATLGPGLTMGALWLVAVMGALLLVGLGASWLFSALGVFFRDIAPLIQFSIMVLMFASAIFYPASRLPEAGWNILRFNPLLLAVEVARDGVLWGRQPNFGYVAYLYAFGIISCVCGYSAFRRMKGAFADVL